MISVENRVFIGLLLLVWLQPGEAALNQAADNDIKSAIRSAIQDGLNTIDAAMRTEYWYYLRGSQRLAFNVTVKPSSLNFIVIFRAHTSLYRVNCDLIKTTWLPKLNNFVEVVSYDSSFESLTSYAVQDSQLARTVDLTNRTSPLETSNPTQNSPVSSQNASTVKNDPRNAPAAPIIVLTPTPGGSLTLEPPHH